MEFLYFKGVANVFISASAEVEPLGVVQAFTIVSSNEVN